MKTNGLSFLNSKYLNSIQRRMFLLLQLLVLGSSGIVHGATPYVYSRGQVYLRPVNDPVTDTSKTYQGSDRPSFRQPLPDILRDRNDVFHKAGKRHAVHRQAIVRTGKKSRALLFKGDGSSWYIYPDSRVLITPGGQATLQQGRLLYTPRGIPVEPSAFFHKSFPRLPRRGGTVQILFSTRAQLARIKLQVRGKKQTFFYPFSRKGNHNNYIARFGLDCRDFRRQQPFSFQARFENGIRYQAAESILLYSGRWSGSDYLREYIRDAYPAKKKRVLFYKQIWQAIPARKTETGLPFYKRKGNVLGKALTLSLPKKKAHKPRRKKARRRTLRLPPGKMQLLRRYKAIRAEARIHRKALAESHWKQLWQGSFVRPARHRISSGFGRIRWLPGGRANIHRGIDIASPMNAGVRAPNSGRVRFAGKTVLCGNTVIIDHGQFVFTKIFHMKKLYVKSGQRIRRKQVIGRVGSTGLSTGAHIHWEMWVGKTRVNPLAWTGSVQDREELLASASFKKSSSQQ